jgi:hypothetical protein
MNEQINPIKNINEKDIIEFFKKNNVENNELLLKYVDKLHSEADIEASKKPEESEIINIKTEIKIAELYHQIPDEDYNNYAIESLEEILQNIGNSNLPDELINNIFNLVKAWRSNIE